MSNGNSFDSFYTERYRVEITVEKIAPHINKHIGTKRLEIGDEVSRLLQPLPDDREIMEEMSQDSIYAHALHEKYRKQKEDRESAINHITRVLLSVFKDIIESQDKVNGYPQNKFKSNE